MRLIDPPQGRPWALFVLTGCSLVANVVLFAKVMSLSPVLQGQDDAPVEVASVAEVRGALEAEAVVEPVVTDDATGSGLHLVQATVNHSLARTFQKAVPEHADVVSAVYARLFVWDLDLRRDIQKGDELTLAYSWDGELAHIPVASYRSGKLGQTLHAYRFHAAGDVYPSWWNEDGTEVPRRLVDGPLGGDYEQITSLLKDRPKHKGMDFKVPVGTDVVSPRGGQVTRVDWNLMYNGNCVEVAYDDGHKARFLHLSETIAKPGQRIRAGTVIGKTGNTGRSTAPHLHYEIDKGGRVVDPVDYHGVRRRSLPSQDMPGFQAAVARYNATLTSSS